MIGLEVEMESRTEIVSNISIELEECWILCWISGCPRQEYYNRGLYRYETDTYQKVVCRTKKGRMNRGKPLEDRTGVTCFLWMG